MKQLLLFFAVVVTVLSSCSKSQDELKLEAFKNELDNPSSFEFIEWSDTTYYIELKYKNAVTEKCERLSSLRDSLKLVSITQRQKDDDDFFVKGLKRTEAYYENREKMRDSLEDVATKYNDTAFALKTIPTYFKSIKKWKEKTAKHSICLNNIKSMSKQLDEGLVDFIINYADTAAFDTVFKRRTFKYRATNKHGALEVMEGEISID